VWEDTLPRFPFFFFPALDGAALPADAADFPPLPLCAPDVGVVRVGTTISAEVQADARDASVAPAALVGLGVTRRCAAESFPMKLVLAISRLSAASSACKMKQSSHEYVRNLTMECVPCGSLWGSFNKRSHSHALISGPHPRIHAHARGHTHGKRAVSWSVCASGTNPPHRIPRNEREDETNRPALHETWAHGCVVWSRRCGPQTECAPKAVVEGVLATEIGEWVSGEWVSG
jgi:hypothetical protein